MRILQINAVPYGSTGGIMFSLADDLQSRGHQVLCTSGFTWKGSRREDFFLTSNILEKTAHIWLARLTGRNGCYSVFATHRLLKKIEQFRPDVIHLHNLHGWFVNLPMLFAYIKAHDIPVVWTFHDCWPFTGHCPHFEALGCEKWKTGCHHCAAYRGYPQCFFDNSEAMYARKRQWFRGVPHLTLVTPSRWLAEVVGESFLGEYPVEVIHNGIDLQVFRPTENDFRKRLGCEEKKIILGVAYAWNERKGLDVFCQLAHRLGDGYQIVLVGTDESTEKQLPANILAIRRTHNREELAQIYTAADVFVNPTREDTFPTVNLEALACGTPVITFTTGGSPECLDGECGIAVPQNDVDAMERAIRTMSFSRARCLERAKDFRQAAALDAYRRLYDRTAKNGI